MKIANTPLRIEQYETVLFNANLNPHGIPNSVKNALTSNISSISKYPDIYYTKLRDAVADYAGSSPERTVLGNGSTDLLKLFISLVMPKKALILVPGPSEYEKVLKSYNSEVEFYELKEAEEFVLNIDDLISSLSDDLDMMIIANPNNPTSKKVAKADMEKLAAACDEKKIFLLIDEMYIEFLDDYKAYTSIPITDTYENMAVMRSVSKFFAVPGLRFAYAVINNPEYKEIIDIVTTKNNIASLTAIAVTDMLRDTAYIEDS